MFHVTDDGIVEECSAKYCARRHFLKKTEADEYAEQWSQLKAEYGSATQIIADAATKITGLKYDCSLPLPILIEDIDTDIDTLVPSFVLENTHSLQYRLWIEYKRLVGLLKAEGQDAVMVHAIRRAIAGMNDQKRQQRIFELNQDLDLMDKNEDAYVEGCVALCILKSSHDSLLDLEDITDKWLSLQGMERLADGEPLTDRERYNLDNNLLPDTSDPIWEAYLDHDYYQAGELCKALHGDEAAFYEYSVITGKVLAGWDDLEDVAHLIDDDVYSSLARRDFRIDTATNEIVPNVEPVDLSMLPPSPLESPVDAI